MQPDRVRGRCPSGDYERDARGEGGEDDVEQERQRHGLNVSTSANQETLGRAGAAVPPRGPARRPRRSMSTTKALKWGTAPSVPARSRTGSKSAHGSIAPVLDALDSRPAKALARLTGRGHPVWTFLLAVLDRIRLGRRALDPIRTARHRRRPEDHALASADGSAARFLAHHRDGTLTEASLIGSIIAGGVVLPALAGVLALLSAILPPVACRRAFRLRARRRVRVLPHDDLLRPSRPPRRAPARAPAGEPELSLGPYRGLDRRVLRHRVAPDLEAHAHLATRRDLVGRGGDPDLRGLRPHVPRDAPSPRLLGA